jgi:hypothetical protein
LNYIAYCTFGTLAFKKLQKKLNSYQKKQHQAKFQGSELTHQLGTLNSFLKLPVLKVPFLTFMNKIKLYLPVIEVGDEGECMVKPRLNIGNSLSSSSKRIGFLSVPDVIL